jgi:hypothetical protein
MAGRYSGIEKVKRSYPRGTDKTPGGTGKGGYQITPDQFDRNRERSLRAARARRRSRTRPRDPVTAQNNQLV